MLSNLSDKEIEKIFKKPDLVFNKVSENKTTKINNGIFYYNNEAAIEKGILEFRKKWGKIKLEDNWKMNPNYNVKIENLIFHNLTLAPVTHLVQSFDVLSIASRG